MEPHAFKKEKKKKEKNLQKKNNNNNNLLRWGLNLYIKVLRQRLSRLS